MKYAALTQLQLIEQKKETATSNLAKIKKYMTTSMIQAAYKNTNPPKATQDWISLLVDSDQAKAHSYSLMDEQKLLQTYQDETSALQYQVLLMQHLKQQIKKFETPDDE